MSHNFLHNLLAPLKKLELIKCIELKHLGWVMVCLGICWRLSWPNLVNNCAKSYTQLGRLNYGCNGLNIFQNMNIHMQVKQAWKIMTISGASILISSYLYTSSVSQYYGCNSLYIVHSCINRILNTINAYRRDT